MKPRYIDIQGEKPSEASLSDILRRYWENHGKHLPSASDNRDALAKWLDYWQEASIGELSLERQEAFVKHLEDLGIKRSTIQRTINIGKAAISRAFKREELSAMPAHRVGDGARTSPEGEAYGGRRDCPAVWGGRPAPSDVYPLGPWYGGTAGGHH
jgi:hypothetical protein